MRALALAAGLLLAPAPARGEPAANAPLAVRLADSVLARWPDPASISGKGWEYTNGIVLAGVAEVYRGTREPRFLAYVRRYVDSSMRADGSFDFGEDAAGHNLDRIQPGVLVLFLWDETRDPKYEKAARWLRARFDAFPRNASGGFWHKKKYPNQMWLDGLYMAEPFLAGFGRRFGDGGFCFTTPAAQARLMAGHTRAGTAGLLRHAWDESRAAAWADPKTGMSPEAWGRAMGWYAMALVDVLAELPEGHPSRAGLRDLLAEAACGIRATQDPKTGLWFQVMDKGADPANWLETSASGMFVYALKRGADRGDLDASYLDVARKGWAGLLAQVSEDAAGRPVVVGAVEGMSVQPDFAGYVSKKRVPNLPHGLCALLLAGSAMEGPARTRSAATAAEKPFAFPGAEGFGARAAGGRGGDTYRVTTLADSGPGSLREGVASARGPRTIVFDVAGTIFLASPLLLDKPFLTLSGETAPGGGVTVAGFTTSVARTHDVVVRYLRFRTGDRNCPAYQDDSLNVFHATDVIVDHVSASWSVDETLSVTHSDRVTVQWSIIAQSLDASCHEKGRHGYGSLLRYGDGSLTFHHNLYAHHASRNPRLGDGLLLDFVNNVVYDWGFEAGYSGPAAEGSPRLNYVANVLVAGPSTPADRRGRAFLGGSTATLIHQRENRIDAGYAVPPAPSPAGGEAFAGAYMLRTEPFEAPPVKTDEPGTAYRRVLLEAGTSRTRDAVDRRIVASVESRTGGLIDSQEQVGGWPDAAPSAKR
ncbi:MAG TPA: glycoside hydrolase family 88 protein [Thermoanaerobaculia bacterium]|jgi:unsaturated rhamnogalacturonyl hydrolase